MVNLPAHYLLISLIRKSNTDEYANMCSRRSTAQAVANWFENIRSGLYECTKLYENVQGQITEIHYQIQR